MAHEDFRGQLEELRQKYGVPIRVDFAVEMVKEEFQLVQRSVERERWHDVTVFIRYQGKYAVIEKHGYSKSGVYRAPSGGAQPSESLVDAAKREAREETGLEIELERFVLESHVILSCGSLPPIPWVSYVFLTRGVGGKLEAEDLKEISDVKLVTREELLNEIGPLMMASGSGGFRYRALMTDAFFQELDRLGIES